MVIPGDEDKPKTLMNQRVHQNPLMEVLGLFPRELIHSELTSFPKNHNTCILLNYSVYKIIIFTHSFRTSYYVLISLFCFLNLGEMSKDTFVHLHLFCISINNFIFIFL